MNVVKPEQIERERDQLLQHWLKAFKRHPCWLSGPPRQVVRVLSPGFQDRAMAVRKFHDKLGFCAKGRVETGGLCAGAIFRTASFINTSQHERSGARATQTVHIEHTVPVNVIASRTEAQIANAADGADAAFAWLMKHSVTTAMRKGQDRDYLKGVGSSTTAFDEGGVDEGLPFQRYRQLFAADEVVWDVWNRAQVDPLKLTFERHIATVLSLLREAGAEASFIQRVEAAAA